MAIDRLTHAKNLSAKGDWAEILNRSLTHSEYATKLLFIAGWTVLKDRKYPLRKRLIVIWAMVRCFFHRGFPNKWAAEEWESKDHTSLRLASKLASMWAIRREVRANRIRIDKAAALIVELFLECRQVDGYDNDEILRLVIEFFHADALEKVGDFEGCVFTYMRNLNEVDSIVSHLDLWQVRELCGHTLNAVQFFHQSNCEEEMVFAGAVCKKLADTLEEPWTRKDLILRLKSACATATGQLIRGKLDDAEAALVRLSQFGLLASRCFVGG